MLTQDRNTTEAAGDIESYPVLAETIIYAGALVVLDADGFAMPGDEVAGLVAVGVAERRVDNSAGDERVNVKKGVFRFDNSAAADEITAAHIGDNCYIVDDHTVAAVGTGRSIAGRVEQVDEIGVFVRLGSSLLAAPGGALLAANNLSDVGNAASARASLAVNEGLGTPGIVVGAEAGNAINVAIQLKTVAGADLAVRCSVLAYLSADAAGDTIADPPSGGVAGGTDGLVIALRTDWRALMLVSEADGDIDVVITEAGARTLYLVLVMPDGRLAASGAITFA